MLGPPFGEKNPNNPVIFFESVPYTFKSEFRTDFFKKSSCFYYYFDNFGQSSRDTFETLIKILTIGSGRLKIGILTIGNLNS